MSQTDKVFKAVHHWPLVNPISSAFSEIDDSYSGKCRLELDQKHSAVFPNYQVALSAAGFAINGEIGGYCFVVIKPAIPTEQITHETAQDWAFG